MGTVHAAGLSVALVALATFGVALLTASALAARAGPSVTGDRLSSLDGLRGFLALGVFVHHACIWQVYVRTGVWQLPASRVAVHLGRSSVAVFFMATGFLFGAKLLASRARPLDWRRLYVARVLRIVPLYAVVAVVVWLVAAALTGFTRRVAWRTLGASALGWLVYAVPDVNALPDTGLVIAYVTWSLRWEWLFYLALPLLAVLLRAPSPWRWRIAATSAAIAWYLVVARLARDPWPLPIFVLAFAAGIGAAAVTRDARVRARLCTRGAALVALACTAVAVAAFPRAEAPGVLALLAVAFTIVASGNTIFGVLAWPASRRLGEISYSLYLLHGLLLFVTLELVLGRGRAAALPPVGYWALVVALAPVLVLVASLTFRTIEAPCIALTPHAQTWLARRRATSPRPVQ